MNKETTNYNKEIKYLIDIMSVLPEPIKELKNFYKKYKPDSSMFLNPKNSHYSVEYSVDGIRLMHMGESIVSVNYKNEYDENGFFPEWGELCITQGTPIDLCLSEMNSKNPYGLYCTYDMSTKFIEVGDMPEFPKRKIECLDDCKEFIFTLSLEQANLVDANNLWNAIEAIDKFNKNKVFKGMSIQRHADGDNTNPLEYRFK